MRTTYLKIIGAGISSLGMSGVAAACCLTAGVAAATISVGTTGPLSTNQTSVNNANAATVANVSNVMATNGLFQVATSGSSGVSFSTNGGAAAAGSDMNTSTTSTNVSVTNSDGSASGAAGGDSINLDNTGPASFNSATITNSNGWSQTNTTNVTVTSCGNRQCGQTATSGNASSALNTNGGSAVSGGASNANSNSTSITISN